LRHGKAICRLAAEIQRLFKGGGESAVGHRDVKSLKGIAMALRRVALLAGMLAFVCCTGSATAQVPLTGKMPDFDNAPPAPPPGAGAPGMMGAPPPGMQQGGFAPPPPAAQQQQGPPCFQEFMPLRQAAEKRASLIKNAADHKAPRSQVCQLFKEFATAEAKVVRFVSENQSACQIPNEAVTQMKANHDRTMKTRDQICNNAQAAGGGPPPGPRLSDELGLRGIAGPGNTGSGHGTFDTLTGNPLGR